MAKRTSRAVLRNAQLIMTSTQLDEGESVTSTMNISTSTLTKDVYVRKHVVYNGEFTVSFPGADEPDEPGIPGEVFPRRETYRVSQSRFAVTATKPNSTYYCVFPIYETDKLNQVDTVLNPGESLTVNTCTVAFVFGSSFTVNGTTATNTEAALACETKTATIVAQSDSCQVVEISVVR